MGSRNVHAVLDHMPVLCSVYDFGFFQTLTSRECCRSLASSSFIGVTSSDMITFSLFWVEISLNFSLISMRYMIISPMNIRACEPLLSAVNQTPKTRRASCCITTLRDGGCMTLSLASSRVWLKTSMSKVWRSHLKDQNICLRMEWQNATMRFLE